MVANILTLYLTGVVMGLEGHSKLQNFSYWSSSESSATYAWFQYYNSSNPGYQNNFHKTNYYRARACRRSIL